MPTRHGLMFAIGHRYASRFHMFLVIAASFAVAVLVTRMLLAFGVETLWQRYIPALLAAYAAFFVGVWVWLHLSQYGRHLRAARPNRSNFTGDAGIDLPIPTGSAGGGDVAGAGGGTFDGGGASGAWDSGEALSVAAPDVSAPDLPDIDIGGGDDGGLLLVIAIALIALALTMLLGAASYVIWQAPAILAEVVFEVLLASTLIKGVRGVRDPDWSMALLRRTWKPFMLVAAAAIVFAGYARSVAPQARTAGEVLQVLSAGKK